MSDSTDPETGFAKTDALERGPSGARTPEGDDYSEGDLAGLDGCPECGHPLADFDGVLVCDVCGFPR